MCFSLCMRRGAYRWPHLGRGIWQIGRRAPETHITPGSLGAACPQDVATLAGHDEGWAPLFLGPLRDSRRLPVTSRTPSCLTPEPLRLARRHTHTYGAVAQRHVRAHAFIHWLIPCSHARLVPLRNIPMATVFCLCSSELERFAPRGGGRTGGGQLNSTQQTLSQGSDYYCDNTPAYRRMHTNTPVFNLLIWLDYNANGHSRIMQTYAWWEKTARLYCVKQTRSRSNAVEAACH